MHLENDAEALRLRGVLRDLVALSAIPAMWVGRDPPAIAAGLADALVGLLQLDFAFVRLSDPSGAGAIEVARVERGRAFRNGSKASPRTRRSPARRSFPTSATTRGIDGA